MRGRVREWRAERTDKRIGKAICIEMRALWKTGIGVCECVCVSAQRDAVYWIRSL